MKKLLLLALSLVSLSVCAAEQPIEMLVVAEQNNPAAPSHPTVAQSVTYVACDAGYVEAGDPIGGEITPTAAELSQSLQASLAAQGYQPASGSATPSILLTYHWGTIRRSSYRQSGSWEIDPNLRARLELVATSSQAGMIENRLLREKFGARLNKNYPSPALLNFELQNILRRANDDRYFVIVTAYDYHALSRHEAKWLWRVRLSTRASGATMNTALPALLHGGEAFFGTQEPDTKTLSVPLAFCPPSGVQSSETGMTGGPDAEFVQELMQREHKEFAGEKIDRSANKRARESEPLAV